MAEALLSATGGARAARAGEPLRAEGECLYRVPSLAGRGGRPGREDPLRTARAAVVAAAARGEPRLADGHVAGAIAASAGISTGIPLAIELAARGRLRSVEELAPASMIVSHLLTGGRRTALPRNQTMRATLDWKLSAAPRAGRVCCGAGDLCRRLPTQAASTIAAMTKIAGSNVSTAPRKNWCAKSLVAADLGGRKGWYRLLETTRA